MPAGPLISKIRCKNPNYRHSGKNGHTDSRILNKALLLYIATREGVLLEDNTILTKMDSELEELKKNNEIFHYRRNGLFGNVSTQNLSKLSNSIYDMTDKGKNIYHGIISLTEQDALHLGYTNRTKWEDYIKVAMPDIAAHLNIKIQNMTWVAAVHMEKGHPHLHYMLWDNSNRIQSSYIHPSVQKNIRADLSKQMFQEERDKLILEKNMARDYILEFEKDALQELNPYLINLKEKELFSYLGEKTSISKIPEKLTTSQLDHLTEKLSNLTSLLPKKGRISYAFLSPELKKYVDELVDYSLNIKSIQKEYLEYLKHAELLTQTYTKNLDSIKLSKDKVEQDIRKRIANSILFSAKSLRKDIKLTYKKFYTLKNEKYQDMKQQQQEAYMRMKKTQFVTHHCIKLFKNLFNNLSQNNASNQSIYNELKRKRTLNKATMKENAKKLSAKENTYIPD